MSFWPTVASQRLVVPPGTSAQSCPSDSPAVTLLVVHQGSVVVSKVPFLSCSTSSAPACPAGSAVSPAASRAVRDSRVVLRRFTSGLLGGRYGFTLPWERSQMRTQDMLVGGVTWRQRSGRDESSPMGGCGLCFLGGCASRSSPRPWGSCRTGRPDLDAPQAAGMSSLLIRTAPLASPG